MFEITTIPVSFVEPWVSSFEERRRRLCSGEKRVAYYYEKPDNSTFRYRIYNMMQVIETIEDISSSYFCSDDIPYLDQVLDSIDVLVICRSRYTVYLNQFIHRAKSKGVRVLYDVDDLVFDVQYIDLILDTLDQDLSHPAALDHWFAYVGRMGSALKLCDGCITTNDYLGKRISDFYDVDINVVPNFLNKEQLEFSNRIYDEKSENGYKRSEDINIGYFSGTPTHNKDFELVAESIKQLFNTDSRVRLRIAGYIDLPSDLNKYSEKIEMYPFQDFVNLQRLISFSEINIVPLQNNIFTNCKSELKYFEASVVGTITIASPTYVYNENIIDSKNGYLSRDYEWTSVLNNAISTIGTDAYIDMAMQAKKDSEEKYAWYNQCDILKNMFM
jgi:glycosyltransferase involved in cell wall biosynthesis